MKKILLIILAIIILVSAWVFIWHKSSLPAGVAYGKVRQLIDAPSHAAMAEKNVEQVLPEVKSTDTETSIIFGGDVMLSRVVGQKMVKYQDFTWPFVNIASTFSSADLAVVNLESPFSNSKDHTVLTGSFAFNADPKAMAGLKLAGIDLVDLANNHFGNMGREGMLYTIKLLASSSIGYVGAGKNEAEASSPKIYTINGIKFGFLAYGYPDDSSVAVGNMPGIATMDLVKAKEAIKELKNQADVVIVLIHAGVEYQNLPNAAQKTFARGVIDAGADLVIGSHPHWVQKMEVYHGKPILYSLGNLVFDQMWSQTTREGMVAKAYFKDKKLTKLEFLPIEIEDYGQSKFITDETQKEKVLGQIGVTTSEMKF